MKKLLSLLLSCYCITLFAQTTVDPLTKDTIVKEIKLNQRMVTVNVFVTDTTTVYTVKKYNGSVVVIPPVIPPTVAGTLVNETFEKGWGVMRPTQIGRGTVVSTLTDVNNHAFRAEVRGTDASKSSGNRDEILPPETVSDQGDMWYGYNMYIEKLVKGGGGHGVQWHPNNGYGSANLSLYLSNLEFQVVQSFHCTQYGATAYCNDYQQGILKKVELKKWYSIVWHVKWSTGSDGLVELYIDDQLYFTRMGKNMDGEGVYFKFGMNRWSISSGMDWTIFYDNLKIARNANKATVQPPKL